MSNRLYLRDILETDSDMIYRLHNDQQVMTYMPYKNISRERSVNDTRAYMKLNSDNPGFGIWVTILKETEQIIGWTCLKELPGTGEIEIGYRYFPQFWNKGYCTEICRKVIEYGFLEKNLDKIVGIVHPENIASYRVLEKLGFTYRRMEHHYGLDVKFFTLSKEEWLKMN